MIISVLCVALGLLGGCSTLRFAYNRAPELTYWWLDGYVDFNEAQAPPARAAIAAWFRWNRSTQLAEYVMLLGRAQTFAAEAATPAQACQLFDDASAQFEVAVDRALLAMAATVGQLTPAQLKHLADRYGKNNKEFVRDYLQPDPKERLDASIKRVVERAERVYGTLNEAQHARLARGVAESPFDAQAWLAERQWRQQETLGTLRRLKSEHLGVQETDVALKRLFDHTMRSPHPAYADYQKHLKNYNCVLAAQIHNLSTMEQRQRAVHRLKGWADDLRALAAAPG